MHKHTPIGSDMSAGRREAALLRLLALPGVVRIHDEWEDASGWTIVMEVASGEPFPGVARAWPELEPVLADLAENLAMVHARGIVHADLKPTNVFVTSEGRTTLLDFGFAADSGAADPSDLGFTPGWAAPEVLAGAAATPASDVYAVGLMWIAALGADLGTLRRAPDLRRIATQVLDAVATVDLTDEARGLLAGALALDPTQRPTAAEIARALRSRAAAVGLVDPHRLEPTADAARALLAELVPDPDRWSAELERWLASGIGVRVGDGVALRAHEVARLGLSLLTDGMTWEHWPARLREARAAIARVELRSRMVPVSAWLIHEARRRGAVAREREALGVLAALALHAEAEASIHTALLECARASEPVPEVEALLRAGIESRFRRRFASARELLDAVGQPSDPELDVAMHLVRSWALREDPDALVTWLDGEAADWARGDPRREAWRLRWRGLVCYQRGDWRGAVDAVLARGALTPRDVGDLCNEASARIELGQAAQAADLAREAVELARPLLEPELLAHATWLERNARYRACAPFHADPALVDAAAEVGVRHESLFALTEAATAWRSGEMGLAARLADRAAAAFRARGIEHGALLASALAANAANDRARADTLLRSLPPGVVGPFEVQTLALLHGTRLRGFTAGAVCPNVQDVTSRTARMDVLSFGEVSVLQEVQVGSAR